MLVWGGMLVWGAVVYCMLCMSYKLFVALM